MATNNMHNLTTLIKRYVNPQASAIQMPSLPRGGRGQLGALDHRSAHRAAAASQRITLHRRYLRVLPPVSGHSACRLAGYLPLWLSGWSAAHLGHTTHPIPWARLDPRPGRLVLVLVPALALVMGSSPLLSYGELRP